MCACPVATIRWALDRAGSRQRRPDRVAGRHDVGDEVEGALDVAQQPSPARVVERERAHHTVEDAEVVHERFGVRVDDDQIGALEPVQRLLAGCRGRSEGGWTELRERRVRGRLDREHEPVPAPRRRRRWCVADGSPGPAVRRRRGRDPRTGTRRHRGGSRGRSRPRRGGRPSRCGISPVRRNHVVPHGAPHLEPTAKSVSRSSVGPASTESCVRSTSTSGTTRSHQLTRDASFHERPVVVHPRTLPNPGNDPSELSASDCQMRDLKQTERGFRRGSGEGDGDGFGAAAAGADRVAHALALDEGGGRLGADGLMFVWCTNRSSSSGRAMKP